MASAILARTSVRRFNREEVLLLQVVTIEEVEIEETTEEVVEIVAVAAVVDAEEEENAKVNTGDQ